MASSLSGWEGSLSTRRLENSHTPTIDANFLSTLEGWRLSILVCGSSVCCVLNSFSFKVHRFFLKHHGSLSFQCHWCWIFFPVLTFNTHHYEGNVTNVYDCWFYWPSLCRTEPDLESFSVDSFVWVLSRPVGPLLCGHSNWLNGKWWDDKCIV